MKKVAWFLAFMVTLAAAGGGGYAIYLERQDRAEIAELKKAVDGFEPRFTKFKAAVGDLGKDLTSLVLEEVDLTKGGWQPIGKGFYLVDVTALPVPNGLRIRGKIINATAVVHENLVFGARIKKSAATINIPRAAPAVAIPFEVTLAGVPPGEGKKAFLELQSSTISFSSTTGKTPSPGEPFDSEKILRGGN